MSENKWKALDHCDNNKENADVQQEGTQVASTQQQSFEWIVVKDSEEVEVHTTDTQAAVSIQAALQVAIAIVISITVGDTEKGQAVVQDLKQFFKSKQAHTQKTIIKNSKCVKVTTTDTQIAVNIQALVQILVAIVAKIDVL